MPAFGDAEYSISGGRDAPVKAIAALHAREIGSEAPPLQHALRQYVE